MAHNLNLKQMDEEIQTPSSLIINTTREIESSRCGFSVTKWRCAVCWVSQIFQLLAKFCVSFEVGMGFVKMTHRQFKRKGAWQLVAVEISSKCSFVRKRYLTSKLLNAHDCICSFSQRITLCSHAQKSSARKNHSMNRCIHFCTPGSNYEVSFSLKTKTSSALHENVIWQFAEP